MPGKFKQCEQCQTFWLDETLIYRKLFNDNNYHFQNQVILAVFYK